MSTTSHNIYFLLACTEAHPEHHCRQARRLFWFAEQRCGAVERKSKGAGFMPEIEGLILVGESRAGWGAIKRACGRRQSFVERCGVRWPPLLRLCASSGAEIRRRLGDGAGRSRAVVRARRIARGAGGLRQRVAAIVACDLPFVTGELFMRLAGWRENFEAVVPVQADGRLQPLCALYRKGACLSRAEELIAAGERRPRVLLEGVRTRRIMPEELADLSAAELFFTNVNTPPDYARALRRQVTSDVRKAILARLHYTQVNLTFVPSVLNAIMMSPRRRPCKRILTGARSCSSPAGVLFASGIATA